MTVKCLILPRINLDPVDGFVSSDELTEWNMRTAEKEVSPRTVRDVEVHDKNRDGFVSFQEYEPPSRVQLSSSDNSSNGDGLILPRIDLDHVDGFVSSDELTEWNMRTAEKEVSPRTVRDVEVHDKNRDGFVSFQEYEPPSRVRLSSSDNSSNGDGMGW
ncbi:uncharacterized protein LOC143891060 [Tasmannia lanceolata]|uniref:uncharacterized protein LOC143891060 n=1 Tax=Tasmannia lanceolata TaxID=3420 RepID=UPI004063C87C